MGFAKQRLEKYAEALVTLSGANIETREQYMLRESHWTSTEKEFQKKFKGPKNTKKVSSKASKRVKQNFGKRSHKLSESDEDAEQFPVELRAEEEKDHEEEEGEEGGVGREAEEGSICEQEEKK
jgi:hypothetical protein